VRKNSGASSLFDGEETKDNQFLFFLCLIYLMTKKSTWMACLAFIEESHLLIITQPLFSISWQTTGRSEIELTWT